MERTGSGPPLVAARSLNKLPPGPGDAPQRRQNRDRATEVPFFPPPSNQASLTRRAYDGDSSPSARNTLWCLGSSASVGRQDVAVQDGHD